MIDKTFTADELRTWASQCEDSANDPRITGDERDRLLRMRTALMELARTTDWLEGQTGPVTVEFVCESDRAG